MASVGVRIKRERSRRDLTQQQLSAATGVPVRTLRRIEKEEVLDSSAITRLCDYLQIPEDEDALVTTRHDPPLSQATFMECLLRLYELHRQATGGQDDGRAPVELSAEPPPVALAADEQVIKVRPPDDQKEGQTGTGGWP